MAEHILITGGAGFIGANLALGLVERGYRVTVLDSLSGQIHGIEPRLTSTTYKLIIGKVDLIEGSVTSAKDLGKAVKNVDIIVHLAAETGTGQSMYRSTHYEDVNIGGTRVLLDVLGKTNHHVKKIVLASSRAIYGEGKYWGKELGFVYPGHRNEQDMKNGDFDVKYPGSGMLTAVATDEASKIHPSSVYGITKQKQEQLIMAACPAMGIAPVIFRYQNVYGPGQSLNNPYTGILSIFSSLIKTGNGINVFEDGQSTRDFVYIDDVVNATIAGIEMPEAKGGVFNVGTGHAITILTVVEELMRNYGVDVPVNISGNFRAGDIRHNFADITKIRNVLRFTPKVTFKDGVRLFAEWVNQQEIPESKYVQSLVELKTRGLFK